MYQCAPTRKTAVIDTINTWIGRDDLVHISVQRPKTIQGKTEQPTIPGSEMEGEELAQLGTGEAILENVIQTYGFEGGRLQVRGKFQGESEDGTSYDRMLRVRIPLRRVPDSATGSTGTTAGIETLTTSLSGVVDGLAGRQAETLNTLLEAVGEVQSRQDDFHEQRFSDASAYQQQIMNLSIDNARLQLQVAVMEQNAGSTIPPEMWLKIVDQGLPAVLEMVGRMMPKAPELSAGPSNGVQSAPSK